MSRFDEVKEDLDDPRYRTRPPRIPPPPSTPAAKWRENGEDDPHKEYSGYIRAKLTHGEMTDDELANAVYLYPHRDTSKDMFAILMTDGPSSITLLTAAKERIRWLSRVAENQAKELEELRNKLTTTQPE